MKRVTVQFRKIGVGLHMRPAAMIVRFATLFSGHKITLTSTEQCLDADAVVDAKSIMNLTMATVRGDSIYNLFVRAKNRRERDAEEAVLLLMKAFFENMHLAWELYSDTEVDLSRSRDKRERFLSIIKEILKACPQLGADRVDAVEADMSEMLQLAAKSVQVKSGAILRSARGLHHASVSLINKVASKFACSIIFVFVDENKEAQSCDPRNLIELLSVGVKNGTRISIKARGNEAEKAVNLIRKILENLGRLEEIAIERRVSIERTEEALSFLKEHLNLSDSEMPAGY